MTLHNAGGTQPPRTDKLDLTQPLSAWMPTLWYPGYMDGMPDLLIGRLPASFEQPFKLFYVETPGERAALLAALEKPIRMTDGVINFRDGPDRTCSRRSRLRVSDLTVYLYPPSEPGWPFFLVTAYPDTVVREVGPQEFGRERYTIEHFSTEEEATAFMVQMGVMAGLRGSEIGFVDPTQRRVN
ncbi:hypothetical protein [Aureimonas leprariae]|uniref:Uncharacterized protein n=1 Tax=Plantimonas leprariae TaxID=2615207 RepID=A0A7V7TWC3_9HYPH|nr:hypothetical protein [Aureimonas leprariae]KAB0679680.1 hypothetical protein F6X38_12750 [Aureimonas leprariae]